MLKLARILGLLLLPGTALARDLPNRVPAPALRCGQVLALLNQRGEAIVDTGPFTYERLVRDIGFCPIEQTTEPFFGPSADAGRCFLGYRCKDRMSEGRRGD
ncbi:hypothetical protein [Methylobacterium sp. WSM2598]|uniref:hypothetical protein n=1 Tax=Methylobacterium sp. WSM2598 TaxID=398261 RepID=UPI000375298F|nr:hypothetical protein [Methylobacterium sp. WSM2598]